MSMDIRAPEPCTTDTETVAEAKVNKAIRVIIGNTKRERSNELWGKCSVISRNRVEIP